jgi:NADPH:quinone reductase-like Zn-dependent oxidoreductase
MKAVLLYSYGDPSQLRYEETAMPNYADNEVLVKVRATSINPIDVKIRSGAAKSRFSIESVSADLKGSQFSRCRGEPESLPVVAEHTNAAAAVGDRQSRLRVFSQPVMVSS